MTIQALQSRALRDAATLSRWYLKTMIEPVEILRLLSANRISYVLVGMHGLSAWMRELRATKDIDVIVAARHVKKAVKVLTKAFPNLEPIDLEVVVRVKDAETGDVVVDVLKPVQYPARSVFKNSVRIKEGRLTYRIPTPEMALALKFAPMINLTREDEDKYQDAHDFIRMVKQNESIDLKHLAELEDLVYPGGGSELVEMVRKVRAGEKLKL